MVVEVTSLILLSPRHSAYKMASEQILLYLRLAKEKEQWLDFYNLLSSYFKTILGIADKLYFSPKKLWITVIYF